MGDLSKGINCSDPRILYERVMNKPGDFMHGAKIYYFYGENRTYDKLYPTSKWFKPVYHHLDFELAGGTRCYELIIPKNVQAYGIKSVRFYFKYEIHRDEEIYLYLHYPGQLLTNLDKAFRTVGINEKLEYDLIHEIHHVLELSGEYCNPNIFIVNR